MGYLGKKPTDAPLTSGDIPNLDASKITSGNIAAARLTNATFDDNKLQANVAMLGFKVAVNNDLAKYNLVDQIVDEYEDATGVDASASTNEALNAGAWQGTGGATGGTITYDGAYTIHTINSNADFITAGTITVDYLVVGGGGAGGMGNGGGGGGGAGGYISQTSQSLSAGTYAAVIGIGGTGAATGVNAVGGHGTDTTFNSQTAGGGAGGPDDNGSGIAGDSANGGSGSGASGRTSGNGGAAGTQGTANGGGDSTGDDGGGGGGAGGAGSNASAGASGGAGGVGLSNSITGSAVFYAGGGGGATEGGSTASLGGNGGGGNGHAQGGNIGATDGTDGKGGGGGGGDTAGSTPLFKAGDGGNGVVIVRTATVAADLTLQSTDTTASTANPDYADMVILMENAHGTATLNTDIKGYISEDSGVTFTQGTLVDEGTWGTNKKIIAFHDLDISAQTGSAMCYKITTHNQSAGSKETKIHATSIGWR